jgi:hypothetical protein
MTHQEPWKKAREKMYRGDYHGKRSSAGVTNNVSGSLMAGFFLPEDVDALILEAHTAGTSAMLQRVREVTTELQLIEGTETHGVYRAFTPLADKLDTLQKEIEGATTIDNPQATEVVHVGTINDGHYKPTIVAKGGGGFLQK